MGLAVVLVHVYWFSCSVEIEEQEKNGWSSSEAWLGTGRECCC